MGVEVAPQRLLEHGIQVFEPAFLNERFRLIYGWWRSFAAFRLRTVMPPCSVPGSIRPKPSTFFGQITDAGA
jgi:hypothetical protein